MAAEPERVVHGGGQIDLAWTVGDDIEIEPRVGVLKVDRRWNDSLTQRHDDRDRFDRARGTEQVPGHGLGARQNRVRSDGLPDTADLAHVTHRGGRGVGVDMPDVGAGQAGFAQRHAHGPHPALRVGLNDVEPVGGHSGSDQPRVHGGAARGGVLGAFQHDGAGTFTENEPVPAGVPRTRRPSRLVIASRQCLHRREPRQR